MSVMCLNVIVNPTRENESIIFQIPEVFSLMHLKQRSTTRGLRTAGAPRDLFLPVPARLEYLLACFVLEWILRSTYFSPWRSVVIYPRAYSRISHLRRIAESPLIDDESR